MFELELESSGSPQSLTGLTSLSPDEDLDKQAKHWAAKRIVRVVTEAGLQPIPKVAPPVGEKKQ